MKLSHHAKRLSGLTLIGITILFGCSKIDGTDPGEYSPDTSFEDVRQTDSRPATAVDLQEGQEMEVTVAVPPRPVNDNPNQFLGLHVKELSAGLGRPDLIRRDGIAEVYQYRESGCVLTIFLYPGQETEHLEARFVDLRGTTLTEQQRRECFLTLIQNRSGTG